MFVGAKNMFGRELFSSGEENEIGHCQGNVATYSFIFHYSTKIMHETKFCVIVYN